MTRIYNRKKQTATRRKLRADSPKAERILWWRLRNKQLDGLKFRRQYGVGGYVIDFYCPAARLAVEIDGESHYHPPARRADARRQAYIESLGIRMLRFANPQVYDALDEVMQVIWRVASQRLKESEKNPPQSPLGKGGGGHPVSLPVKTGGDPPMSPPVKRASSKTLVGAQGRDSAPLLTKEGVGGGSLPAPPRTNPSKAPPQSPLGKGGGAEATVRTEHRDSGPVRKRGGR